MARVPLTMPLIRFGGTASARARALMLSPRDRMNSSIRISPGGMGSSKLGVLGIGSPQ